MHGVAVAVMSFLALPHWQAKSVALQPAVLMAVLRQVREQEGSWAWRDEMDCADATARDKVRVRRAGKSILAVDQICLVSFFGTGTFGSVGRWKSKSAKSEVRRRRRSCATGFFVRGRLYSIEWSATNAIQVSYTPVRHPARHASTGALGPFICQTHVYLALRSYLRAYHVPRRHAFPYQIPLPPYHTFLGSRAYRPRDGILVSVISRLRCLLKWL